MSSGAEELVEVVYKRFEVLQLVCEDSPEKRALVESVSKSRPTVDRAIRELESHGLVHRESGVCKPTYTGRVAYDLYSGLAESFATLEDTRGELLSLPRDADLDEVVFQGGTVLEPPEHAPYTRIEPMYEDVSSCDELVGVTRVVLPPYIDRIIEYGARDVADTELVVNTDILDVLLENQQDRTLDCIESGNTIYTAERLPNYCLFLVDDTILYIALYSGSNHLSTVIRNTDSQAVQWAENKISKIKSEASPVKRTDHERQLERHSP
ncbi:helix-turn-helix transcriptional regulator [Halobacterium jilantaiense]|uniref:Predicted transcriptional regulator, contains HTH domain n=1 Tax=Halobacterium jilantaiense TaxID=355548 RepID=A0A1I0MWE0_9EURY|nr:GntR family transcriptional regulator [Halobacterium jilantaiense]SEV93099.1 Predicted transcriptional regulator, contains HTH domain [Halobacterium jilantaiense]